MDDDREKNKFTNRADEYTNMSATISIHDSLLEIYFKTPDHNGDIYIKVPWSRKRMEKYLNPFVFGELIDRLFSLEIYLATLEGRLDVEEAEARNALQRKRNAGRAKRG